MASSTSWEERGAQTHDHLKETRTGKGPVSSRGVEHRGSDRRVPVFTPRREAWTEADRSGVKVRNPVQANQEPMGQRPDGMAQRNLGDDPVAAQVIILLTILLGAGIAMIDDKVTILASPRSAPARHD